MPPSRQDPIDIRTPGATEALSDVFVLTVWEVLRRRRSSASVSEVATATMAPVARVTAALDALERLRLVERSRTSSRAKGRARKAGWKVTRDTIVVGFRRGDAHDQGMIARMSRLFDRERRAEIKRHAKTQPQLKPHEFIYNGMHAGALTAAEYDELAGLLMELDKFFQRCNLRHDGAHGESPQHCNCHVSVDVDALREGILPIPSMRIIDLELVSEYEPQVSRKPVASLSAREREVATRLSSGQTIAAAAKELGLSTHTVRELTRRAYRKLGVSNRAQLVSRLK